MGQSLPGRVVAVTGGARGIGLATAQQLRDQGAHVAIGDSDPDALAQAAQLLGPDMHAGELDVSDRTSLGRWLDGAEDALGPVDVIVWAPMLRPFLPMPARTFLGRAFKLDRVFLDHDKDARRDHHDRISQ